MVCNQSWQLMELAMKRVILTFFPILACAAVTNVRVVGTTATQAILAYTAPDNSSCTVAMSPSAGFTPLARDVDPSLFSGANSDGRPGSIAAGRSRLFVAGKRSVERDIAGNNSSRALQAATTYYFRITCPSDGSTATGTFETTTIPNGVGFGEPIPTDPGSAGNYLYPTFSKTDRGSSAIDPHTGALVKNLTLPGDVQGGASVGMTSSGMGQACHPKAVKASDSDKYGYHCAIGGRLYWIVPDGETRFLGFLGASYVNNGWNNTICGQNSLSHILDKNDPNVYYCVAATKGTRDGHITVLKGTYTGHSVSGQDADQTNLAFSQIHTIVTEIMVVGRTLDVLMPEFDPLWTTRGACCSQYWADSWFDGKMLLRNWSSNQNNPAWFFVYDPAQTAAMQIAKFGNANGCIDNPPITGSAYAGRAGCIIVSQNTTWGPPGSGFRWMGHHSLNDLPTDQIIGMTNNPIGQNGKYYRVTLPNGLGASGSTCSTPKPEGSTIQNWPDSSWTSGCSTFTVSGDPALNAPTTGWPATFPAAPGDMLTKTSWTGGAYITTEVMRLLDKGSNGNTWYVQRQWPDTSRAYTPVAAGGTLDMLSPIFLSKLWWDPATGTTYGDTLPLLHSAHINSQFGSWSLVAGMIAQPGRELARLLDPASYPTLTLKAPKWNGISGSAYESHPSLSIIDPPDDDTYRQVVDNEPYYGDSRFVTAGNVALMGGQLYRIRGTNVATNYKLISYFANSGSRAMKEVSGPSALLATDASTQFQWCVALKAGECYSGSQANDVYFNAPGIANAYCTNNWTTIQSTLTIPNDICVSPALSTSQAVLMQAITNDPFGLQLRVISNSLSKYEQESNFWNSRTLPDGSWLFTSLAADPGGIKLLKIPPRIKDSINRTAYVPVSVSLPAATGVDNALIEFGYMENGNPGNFYCTARQENCVAQSATISAAQPFSFGTTEANAIKGMPCRSGCTITIPGVPGRVVYYRASSRDASGRVVGQQYGAQVVP